MSRNSGVPCEEIYKEQWRDIAGWPNYQVSDLGRIRRLDRGSWWMVSGGKVIGKKIGIVLCNNEAIS